MTDADLVARARATGAAEWFEELARRHYRAAFAVALAIMGNVEDAEDVCHDGLVRALARIAECRQPDRFAEWLAAIVRNHSRNELARVGRRRRVPLEAISPEQRASPEMLPRSATITAALESEDMRTALEHALAQLTEVQREVVLLHDLHDWPHARIAQHIGTSPGMCRQHLFHARRTLRTLLDPGLLKEGTHE